MGVGDFQVVAEDLVEADLDVGDAGLVHRFGLIVGHPLFAALHQLALLVESA